jgi:magnesium-transporting ATPase (P-type)
VILCIYIVSLLKFCDGEWSQTEILKLDDYQTKLMKARTVAFIALVFAENIRAYIARYFDKPFYTNLCGNRQMQKAIILAQVALYVAVFTPTLSDEILKLDGVAIGAWGWLVALAGPVGTLILSELCKVITRVQVVNYNRKLEKERNAEIKRLEEASATKNEPVATDLKQEKAMIMAI